MAGNSLTLTIAIGFNERDSRVRFACVESRLMGVENS